MTGEEIVAADMPEPNPSSHTKFTADVLDRFLESIAGGLSPSQACVACGISKSTFQTWKTDHPDFVESLESAREQFRQTALEVIRDAMHQDYKAAESLLKLSFARDGDYKAKPDVTKVQVNTQGVFGEEQRVRIQEYLRKQREAYLSLSEEQKKIVNESNRLMRAAEFSAKATKARVIEDRVIDVEVTPVAPAEAKPEPVESEPSEAEQARIQAIQDMEDERARNAARNQKEESEAGLGPDPASDHHFGPWEDWSK